MNKDLKILHRYLINNGFKKEAVLLVKVAGGNSDSDFFLDDILKNRSPSDSEKRKDLKQVSRDDFIKFLGTRKNPKINHLLEKCIDRQFFQNRFIYVHFIGLYSKNLSRNKTKSEIITEMVREYNLNKQKLDLSTMAIDSKVFNLSEIFNKYNKKFIERAALMLIVDGTPTLANTRDSGTISDESGNKTFNEFNEDMLESLFWNEESFNEASEHKRYYSEVVLKNWKVTGMYIDASEDDIKSSDLFLTSLNLNIPIYARDSENSDFIISSAENYFKKNIDGEIYNIALNNIFPLETLKKFLALKNISEDEIDFCYKVADKYFSIEHDTSNIEKFIKNIIMNEIYQFSNKEYSYILEILKKHKNNLEFIDSLYSLTNLIKNILNRPLGNNLNKSKIMFDILKDNIEYYSYHAYNSLVKERLRKLSDFEFFYNKEIIPEDIFNSLMEEKLGELKELDYDLIFNNKNRIPSNLFDKLFDKLFIENFKSIDIFIFFKWHSEVFSKRLSKDKLKEISLRKIKETKPTDSIYDSDIDKFFFAIINDYVPKEYVDSFAYKKMSEYTLDQLKFGDRQNFLSKNKYLQKLYKKVLREKRIEAGELKEGWFMSIIRKCF